MIYPVLYLVAPGEDERPDVAAVEVLCAVEERSRRVDRHRGHLKSFKIR